MLDDLTKKEKGFSDDCENNLFDGDELENLNLIIKKSFYVKEADNLVFLPSGSSMKLMRYTMSIMPYYEVKIFVIYCEMENNKKITLKASQNINSKEVRLTNCVCMRKNKSPKDNIRVNISNALNNQNTQKYNFSLNVFSWSEVFVQDFNDVINV